MIFYLDPSLMPFFNEKTRFDEIMSLKGETFRALENRRTQKITLGNKNYFIKQHYGIGWKEIFKNLLALRLPITSAKNEWLAIKRLHELNIPTQTIMGFGYRGWNPAKRESFLITEELSDNISLEYFCRDWKKEPPAFQLKYHLIQEVARIARTLHSNGINHRDFYLCHFLLLKGDENCKLYVIDLHRAQIRSQTPIRWIIKDLAGLYFSSLDIGLTRRDCLRFIKAYRNKPLREVLNKEPNFWHKVKQRGDKLYTKHAN